MSSVLTSERVRDGLGYRPLRYVVLLVVAVLFCTNGGLSPADEFIGALIAVNVIAALGQVVMYGWTGLLSVGQAALVGTSAYTFAIAENHGHGVWASALLAMVFATFGGALLGVVGTRIRSHYFVLVTLALAEVVNLVLDNQITLTGGENGLPAPIGLDLGFVQLTSSRDLLVGSAVVAVLGMYVCSALKSSRLGLGMRTLNANEILGLTSGVSPRAARIAASSVAGVFAGVAGILFAAVTGFLGPSDFNLAEALVLLVGVVIGGMASVPGATMGVIVTSYLAVGVPSLNVKGPLIYGLAVIVVLMITPVGLAGTVSAARRWVTRMRPRLARRRVAAERPVL